MPNDDEIRELANGNRRPALMAMAQEGNVVTKPGANKEELALAILTARDQGDLTLASGLAEPTLEPMGVQTPIPRKPIQARPHLVTIRPRKTIHRFRVGPDWYSVFEGRETQVPPNVRDHLAEKGII